MKKIITFREIITKTMTIDGETKEEIKDQVDYLIDNPDEIDFEKNIDSYNVDAIYTN